MKMLAIFNIYVLYLRFQYVKCIVSLLKINGFVGKKLLFPSSVCRDWRFIEKVLTQNLNFWAVPGYAGKLDLRLLKIVIFLSQFFDGSTP